MVSLTSPTPNGVPHFQFMAIPYESGEGAEARGGPGAEIGCGITKNPNRNPRSVQNGLGEVRRFEGRGCPTLC